MINQKPKENTREIKKLRTWIKPRCYELNATSHTKGKHGWPSERVTTGAGTFPLGPS